MKKLSLLLTLFVSMNVLAADKWNTYQWNRSNVLAGNSKVDQNPWYEWWYYKIVLPESGKSFFFVYTVVNPWDHGKKMKGTRSTVGMGDFSQKIQVEEEFNVSDFNASYNETYVEVRGNVGTDKYLQGSLTDQEARRFTWDVSIEKDWSYNAEGWMMGSGITDIEWYPAQAGARCSGSVTSAGETITFTDAPCYQDRNWGSRFPDWWTWIVSNHFKDHPGTILAIGGGKPTVFQNRTPIATVSIGLRHKGIEYSFRPIDMQYVKADISFGTWNVMAINRTHKIEIVAHAPKEKFMDLQFVTPDGQVFHDYETLTGKVSVKLFKRKGLFFEPVANLFSDFAGIEFGSADLSTFADKNANLITR